MLVYTYTIFPYTMHTQQSIWSEYSRFWSGRLLEIKGDAFYPLFCCLISANTCSLWFISYHFCLLDIWRIGQHASLGIFNAATSNSRNDTYALLFKRYRRKFERKWKKTYEKNNRMNFLWYSLRCVYKFNLIVNLKI